PEGGTPNMEMNRALKNVGPMPGLNFNTDWAMVGTGNVATDEGALEPRTQGRGNQDVIDAPSDVARPGIAHRAPPGVMPAALFKFAEGVEESCFDKGAEPGPFFEGKSVRALIGLGIGQVDFGVGHVQVAAKDDRF